MDTARAVEAPGTLPSPPALPVKETWVKVLPFIGLGFALADILFLATVWLASHDRGYKLSLLAPILFGAGKEAAIPYGIGVAGFDAWTVAVVMVLTDLAGTFILYPIVHLTMDSLETRRGFLGKMLRGAVRRAEKRKPFVDRYGVAGLYLFSIIPFAFNGPPIVAALGRLAGMRASRVVPVLVAAIVTTTAAWCIFYSRLRDALATVNKLIPILLSVSIMLIMVGISVVSALLDRSEDAPPAAPPPT